MLARLRRHLHAAQHARELLDAFSRVQFRETRARGLAVGEFRDAQVLMALGCDLRQVRDTDDLTRVAERAQFPADDFSHGAADTGVDFIEDHAARLARGTGHLHRERQARELSA